jgi:hypothetical protein
MIHYKVVEAEGNLGPWKVSTAAYFYSVQDYRQNELLAYHWHPRSTPEHPEPHLHIYGQVPSVLLKLHMPTRRITLEEFLRFLITELKVKPLRSDWERILREAQAAHEKFRTWS